MNAKACAACRVCEPIASRDPETGFFCRNLSGGEGSAAEWEGGTVYFHRWTGCVCGQAHDAVEPVVPAVKWPPLEIPNPVGVSAGPLAPTGIVALDPFVMSDRGPRLVVPNLCASIQALTGPIRVGVDECLYAYQGGVYRRISRKAVTGAVQAVMGDRFRRSQLLEATAYLGGVRAGDEIPVDPPPNPLNVQNGLLDWATAELYHHTPDFLSQVQLAAPWDPTAECPRFDAFLEAVLPDSELRRVALEVMGYSMVPGNWLHKAVLLLGPGATGKSTFLRILTGLLGEPSVSNVPLQALDTSRNRFAAAQLVGKLANICGDLPAKPMRDTSTFKQLVGEDRIFAERKGSDGFSFSNMAVPIFSANVAPHTHDQSGAYLRRWLILPFCEEIAEADRDPHLAAEILLHERAGILNRTVRALRDLYSRGGFYPAEALADAKQRFAEELDTLGAFLAERCTMGHTSGTPKATLYAAYLVHCRVMERPPVDTGAFGDYLQAKGYRVGSGGNRSVASVRLRPLDA